MTTRSTTRVPEQVTQRPRPAPYAGKDGASWQPHPYGIELAGRALASAWPAPGPSMASLAAASLKPPRYGVELIDSVVARSIQRKPSISSPIDPFEREAANAAEHVMRMPEPASVGLGTGPTIRRSCARCEDEDKPPIQAKYALSGSPEATASTHKTVRVAGTSGSPMPADIRGFFEARFGHDFSTVRVHTGGEAVNMARAIHARAYTVGRDIVFASGQYSPTTVDGKRLLAHELAHVVQQTGRPSRLDAGPKLSHVPGMVQRAAFEDHCSALPQGANCVGTIDVHAGTISLPALAVSHLYIVYTSRDGTAIAFRGGPDGIGGGYGHIKTQCGPYDSSFIDYDTSTPSVRVYSGDRACDKAQCFHDRLAVIAGTNTVYAPTGPNSNSVIAELLHHCGLPLRMPIVTAPGFNMGIGERGVSDLGTTDRRQRVSLGIGPLFGGPSTGLGLTAGYSVDLAHAANQTFRFPLRIGALYDPLSSTALGSASIGVESPLVNLPFPGLRVPTSLGLSAGVTGGVVPNPSPGGSPDAVLGPVVRPNLGLDFNRFRIDLFYQYQYLRGIGMNREQSLHLLGLEAGFTF